MIWYICIVGFDAFFVGIIFCSKSKLVEKSKVQFKSTKGQRQAWEETTYIGKIRLQSSFGRLQPFFTFPAPPEIHRSRLYRNVVTVLQPLLWCGSAQSVRPPSIQDTCPESEKPEILKAWFSSLAKMQRDRLLTRG